VESPAAKPELLRGAPCQFPPTFIQIIVQRSRAIRKTIVRLNVSDKGGVQEGGKGPFRKPRPRA